MWTNISSLAQKAKEAAAIIEGQINESIGVTEGEAPPSETPSGGREVNENESPGGSSHGWEKCDGTSPDDDKQEVSELSKETKPQEISFVDLKAAAEEIPKDDEEKGADTNSALSDAMARIESLEKHVHSLKDELAAAREESQNYHANNLLLEQQVKELQDGNKSLKESGASEN